MKPSLNCQSNGMLIDEYQLPRIGVKTNSKFATQKMNDNELVRIIMRILPVK